MRDLPLHRAPRKSKKEKEKPSCMMQGGHSRIQQGYRFVVRAGDVSAQLRGLYKVYIRFILWMTTDDAIRVGYLPRYICKT